MFGDDKAIAVGPDTDGVVVLNGVEEFDHLHHKVYSSATFDMFPMPRPWICSICGKEGVDHDVLPETYDEVRQRFGKETT